MSIGCYRGVSYKRHRICDVLAVESRARWWFIYCRDGTPTSDHYPTLRELQKAVDRGDHEDCQSEKGMLILSRKVGQAIVIGGGDSGYPKVTVKLQSKTGIRIALAIDAAREVPVIRGEVVERRSGEAVK